MFLKCFKKCSKNFLNEGHVKGCRYLAFGKITAELIALPYKCNMAFWDIQPFSFVSHLNRQRKIIQECSIRRSSPDRMFTRFQLCKWTFFHVNFLPRSFEEIDKRNKMNTFLSNYLKDLFPDINLRADIFLKTGFRLLERGQQLSDLVVGLQVTAIFVWECHIIIWCDNGTTGLVPTVGSPVRGDRNRSWLASFRC